MKVKCILCEKLETIDDDSIVAKRLRNRPIHTYMCDECHDRITRKTNERLRLKKVTDEDEKQFIRTLRTCIFLHKKNPPNGGFFYTSFDASSFLKLCRRIL